MIVPFWDEYSDSGGEILDKCLRVPTDLNGIGKSPTSEWKSSDDSEVTEPSSSESDSSDSVDDSEAVDGWYSCLSGDEERRRTCLTGDKIGADMLFRLMELCDLCGGGGGGTSGILGSSNSSSGSTDAAGACRGGSGVVRFSDIGSSSVPIITLP